MIQTTFCSAIATFKATFTNIGRFGLLSQLSDGKRVRSESILNPIRKNSTFYKQFREIIMDYLCSFVKQTATTLQVESTLNTFY